MNDTSTDSMSNHGVILAQLADIKTSLAVNTNETANIKTVVSEIKSTMGEMDKKVGIQNGRVTKIEDWSNEARKIIESTAKTVNEIDKNYKTDKTRIWTGMAVLLFLGGAIISLSVMAINSKIKDGITDALAGYNIEITQ